MIVILVVLAGLFVIAVALGIVNEGRPHTGNERYPNWVKKLGSLGSERSKLNLRRDVAPDSSCQITPLNRITFSSTCQITLRPAEESFFGRQAFRTATVRVIQGSGISIRYVNRKATGSELDDYTWPRNGDDPTRGSLVILEDGGTLTFTCGGLGPCVVEMEQ